MRKPILAVLALLLAVPALALAGKTVTEGTNTLKVKAAFDPAKASKSKDRLRATEMKFDYFAGDDRRQPPAELRERRREPGRRPSSCSRRSRPATRPTRPSRATASARTARSWARAQGTAEVHGDPGDPSKDTDLELDVKVYNGSLDTDKNGDPMDPRPGLLLYTELGGSNVVFPFWGEKRGKQVALRGPDEDPDPGVDSLFSIKEIHLTIDRRSVRRNGKRIPFLALPTQCDGKWVVTATNDPYEGDPLTAKHKVRCTDA